MMMMMMVVVLVVRGYGSNAAWRIEREGQRPAFGANVEERAWTCWGVHVWVPFGGRMGDEEAVGAWIEDSVGAFAARQGQGYEWMAWCAKHELERQLGDAGSAFY